MLRWPVHIPRFPHSALGMATSDRSVMSYLYHITLTIEVASYKVVGISRLSSHLVFLEQLIGVAQGCLDNTLQYVMERKQFGQPVWKFQVSLFFLHLIHDIINICSMREPTVHIS